MGGDHEIKTIYRHSYAFWRFPFKCEAVAGLLCGRNIDNLLYTEYSYTEQSVCRVGANQPASQARPGQCEDIRHDVDSFSNKMCEYSGRMSINEP